MYYSKFKKFAGSYIDNIIDYIMEVVEVHPNVNISVGVDSVQKRKRTVYAMTIMFYDEVLKNGAHVVFFRESVPKIFDSFTRLYREAEWGLHIAEFLHDNLKKRGYVRNITDFELKKYKFIQEVESGLHKHVKLHDQIKFIDRIELSDIDRAKEYKLVDIHLDFNYKKYSYGRKINKSFKAYEAAAPWLRGQGYITYVKPNSPAGTSAADLLLK